MIGPRPSDTSQQMSSESRDCSIAESAGRGCPPVAVDWLASALAAPRVVRCLPWCRFLEVEQAAKELRSQRRLVYFVSNSSFQGTNRV